MVVTNLKNVNGFQPRQVRKRWSSYEIESCAKTVCPIRILLLVARVHVRVVLNSAVFPVSTWALFITPLFITPLAFTEDKKKIVNKDLVFVQAQIQLQSPKVNMLWSISIACGSHEYKALPIVPVKVKGRGSGEIITTYALLDNGSTSTWCSEGLAKKLGVEGHAFKCRCQPSRKIATWHHAREFVWR